MIFLISLCTFFAAVKPSTILLIAMTDEIAFSRKKPQSKSRFPLIAVLQRVSEREPARSLAAKGLTGRTSLNIQG
jgi:hypothetical protein